MIVFKFIGKRTQTNRQRIGRDNYFSKKDNITSAWAYNVLTIGIDIPSNEFKSSKLGCRGYIDQ